jgi:hypothetical protein
MTMLVRSGTRNDDDRDALRSTVADLDAMLGERYDTLATLKSDLDAITVGASAPCTNSARRSNPSSPRPNCNRLDALRPPD